MIPRFLCSLLCLLEILILSSGERLYAGKTHDELDWSALSVSIDEEPHREGIAKEERLPSPPPKGSSNPKKKPVEKKTEKEREPIHKRLEMMRRRMLGFANHDNRVGKMEKAVGPKERPNPFLRIQEIKEEMRRRRNKQARSRKERSDGSQLGSLDFDVDGVVRPATERQSEIDLDDISQADSGGQRSDHIRPADRCNPFLPCDNEMDFDGLGTVTAEGSTSEPTTTSEPETTTEPGTTSEPSTTTEPGTTAEAETTEPSTTAETSPSAEGATKPEHSAEADGVADEEENSKEKSTNKNKDNSADVVKLSLLAFFIPLFHRLLFLHPTN